jgi:hypothetical protein
MFYRITDADTKRQWKFFALHGGLYAVSVNDSGAASVLKINGARGTATAGTSTTLTDTNQSMTTNVHASAFIRIIDGTGDGQYRQIASNTSTAFTVSVAFDVTPDNTSKYIVYSSDDWLTAAGTPGLGAVKNRPVTVGNIGYFPQGQSVNIRRMRVNATSHDFADDGTNKADLMFFHNEGSAPQVITANAASSTFAMSDVKAWGTNLVPGTAKAVGASDYRITNFAAHQKVLRIFKEDGVYTYNGGVIEKDGQNFSDVPDPTTGLAVGMQNGALWWGWAHDVIRQIGSSYDPMLGYKRGFEGVAEPRKGYISCIVSAVGWLFFVIDGGTDNYSSILVWNGMGWHEIFRGWATGVRIRNAYWQGNFGAKGRLWFDINGDIAWISFPLFAANPLKDTTIPFHHEAVCVTATYDAHDQNLYKVLGLMRVFLDSGTCEIDYQTNANVGTSNWTVLGTADSTPVEDISLNLGGIFQIRFRFRLQVSLSTTPATLSGWQFTGRMMSINKYQFLATFRADSDAETKSDEPDHDPDELFTQLKVWAKLQTKLTLRSTIKSVDASGSGRTVTVALPTKVVDSLDTEENKWTGKIQLAILEV